MSIGLRPLPIPVSRETSCVPTPVRACPLRRPVRPMRWQSWPGSSAPRSARQTSQVALRADPVRACPSRTARAADETQEARPPETGGMAAPLGASAAGRREASARSELASSAVARSHSQAPQAQTRPEALGPMPTGSAESPAQVPGSALSSVREHGGLPTAGWPGAVRRRSACRERSRTTGADDRTRGGPPIYERVRAPRRRRPASCPARSRTASRPASPGSSRRSARRLAPPGR